MAATVRPYSRDQSLVHENLTLRIKIVGFTVVIPIPG
jgi:hypothetical protein